jgi:hypothetical protein
MSGEPRANDGGVEAPRKAAHGHVVYAVQEVPFWAPFDAVFDIFCPGNERCAVESQGASYFELRAK